MNYLKLKFTIILILASCAIYSQVGHRGQKIILEIGSTLNKEFELKPFFGAQYAFSKNSGISLRYATGITTTYINDIYFYDSNSSYSNSNYYLVGDHKYVDSRVNDIMIGIVFSKTGYPISKSFFETGLAFTSNKIISKTSSHDFTVEDSDNVIKNGSVDLEKLTFNFTSIYLKYDLNTYIGNTGLIFNAGLTSFLPISGYNYFNNDYYESRSLEDAFENKYNSTSPRNIVINNLLVLSFGLKYILPF